MIKFVAAALLLVGGCRAEPLQQRAVESEAKTAAVSAAGLEIVPLTISSGGRTHRFEVEVAATPEQQQRGLMFRERLAPGRGMIFPFPAPRPASFWMKDTPSSLDIIFVDAAGRIESIAARTTPLSLDHVTSLGPVAAVLEIAGGRANELGLRPGDRVAWRARLRP